MSLDPVKSIIFFPNLILFLFSDLFSFISDVGLFSLSKTPLTSGPVMSDAIGAIGPNPNSLLSAYKAYQNYLNTKS